MLESFSKGTAQNWKKDFAFEHPRGWVPINVEIGGIRGFRTILEHVHPPGVLAAGRHVIRHDVQNQSQAVLTELVLQRSEVRLGTQLRIEARGIDRVVAVSASAPCAQNGRGVHVRDAELREIVDDLGCVLKGEVFIELQSVGGRNKAGGQGGHPSFH
jgi:hypothetical protein